MLDLDHPQTPHVFAASRQLDLILDYLKRMTYADSQGRLRMLEIIRPCFAALRWLQTERFFDEPHIASGIDELERAAEELARLGDGRAEWPAGELPSACPVCRRSLTTYGVYEPRPGLKVAKERGVPLDFGSRVETSGNRCTFRHVVGRLSPRLPSSFRGRSA